MILGDDLSYNFGKKENIFGEEVKVTVTMQISLHFASYDYDLNSLVVDGDSMFAQDIGVHRVKV